MNLHYIHSRHDTIKKHLSYISFSLQHLWAAGVLLWKATLCTALKTPHNGIRLILCPAVPSKMALSFPNGVTGWALNSFLHSALSEVIGFAVSPPNKVWIMTYWWLLHLLISLCIYKLTEKASMISQSQCDWVYSLIVGGCHDSACHLNNTDSFGGD